MNEQQEILQIPALKVGDWPNNIHLRFHKEQVGILDAAYDEEVPAPAKVQGPLDDYKECVQNEDGAYLIDRASELTEQIAVEDDIRDGRVNDVQTLLTAATKMVSVPAMKQAAETMKPSWDKYKINTHAAYEIESNAIDQWYQEYSADPAQVAAAATLGLTQTIAEMIAATERMSQLIVDRNAAQQAQKQNLKLADARALTDKAYNRFKLYQNAAAVWSDDPHQFDSLIQSLTGQQEYYQGLYEDHRRTNKRVIVKSEVTGNHQYKAVAGWTWARLVEDYPKLLALDPEPSKPGAEPVVTPVRVISVEQKALKAGGLAVALSGTLVKPTDELNFAKDYELIPYSDGVKPQPQPQPEPSGDGDSD